MNTHPNHYAKQNYFGSVLRTYTGGVVVSVSQLPLRAARPKILRDTYANPEKELSRQARTGALVRIAPGTYVARPDHLPDDATWMPSVNDAAMAFAATRWGPRGACLYGVGAAHFHHAIPRAIGVSVVATESQHRTVKLTNGGKVVFTAIPLERLDVRWEQSELGWYYVTIPEQTLVDLVRRPNLGELPEEARSAQFALAARVDVGRTLEIASRYSKRVLRTVEKMLQ